MGNEHIDWSDFDPGLSSQETDSDKPQQVSEASAKPVEPVKSAKPVVLDVVSVKTEGAKNFELHSSGVNKLGEELQRHKGRNRLLTFFAVVGIGGCGYGVYSSLNSSKEENVPQNTPEQIGDISLKWEDLRPYEKEFECTTIQKIKHPSGLEGDLIMKVNPYITEKGVMVADIEDIDGVSHRVDVVRSNDGSLSYVAPVGPKDSDNFYLEFKPKNPNGEYGDIDKVAVIGFQIHFSKDRSKVATETIFAPELFTTGPKKVLEGAPGDFKFSGDNKTTSMNTSEYLLP